MTAAAGPAPGARRGARAASAEAGFTLLEVLVALAIAVPALLLLYRQGAAAVGATRTATAYGEAISRAQSRLDALTGAGLAPGEKEGDDGGGFRWRTRVVPVAALPPSRLSSPTAGSTLYSVVVEISWAGPAGARRFLLETRRLEYFPAECEHLARCSARENNDLERRPAVSGAKSAPGGRP